MWMTCTEEKEVLINVWWVIIAFALFYIHDT